MSGTEVEKDEHNLNHDASVNVGVLDAGEATEHADALRVIEIPKSKWLQRYRSVTFQMLILGILSFSGPSMSDAISSLGGGGQATPYTANTASSAQYALSSVFAMFGGPIIGAIGIPIACIVGAAGFPLSGSGFYVLSKFNIQWYLIFAKTIYGLTSSFLYVAESSSMISFPEEHRRGLYISIWLIARNLGSVIAGSISLSLNIHGKGKGSIKPNTYLAFLALECIGVPAALLLTKTRKVIRSDGYGVPLLPKKSWKQEMRLLWEHHKQRRTLLMVPVYIFTFFGDGVWFTYLGVHFSVRTRALSALLAPISVLVINPLFGTILDQKKWGPRTRGRFAYFVYMGGSLVLVVWGMGMTKWLGDREAGGALSIDYKDNTAAWFAAYIPFWMYYLWSYMGQTLVYWTLGQFASDVGTNARTGGVFRAWETVGQAIAYGVDSNAHTPWISISMLLGLTVISVPCFWAVIDELPKESKVPKIVNAEGVLVDNPAATKENPEIAAGVTAGGH